MAKRGHGEGSIYQRKDGRWTASISLEGDTRKRKYIYGKTRKEVQEQLKIALREQQQGELVTAPQRTLVQFLTDWLENTQKQSVKPRTYERYEEVVRLHIVPVLGRHKLQQLTAQHIQAFYAKKLKQGFSPTTVGGFHNVLHKALKAAVKWGFVSRNVCDLVDAPRREEFEITPLTLEQVHKLLDVVRGHPMEALFILALATGMRRGELLGLKWQDINFATSKLQVRRIMTRVPSKLKTAQRKGYVEAETKTRRSRRSVTIASFALEALKQHRERQLTAKKNMGEVWQERDLVFCTSIGTPLNPTRDVLDQLKKLLKQAELPVIRFHDLRHSAATLLFSEGVHPKVVQEILGHSNISITMNIYSHVLPGMQQDAMDKMNNALNRQGTDGGTEEGNNQIDSKK